jgi:NNP family nitrate/nitrite transporter-like MFS transporter
VARGTFLAACKDYRVWALFLVYGACFGIELTINNVAALYFVDYFDYFQGMDAGKALATAGGIAALFGLMNLFARTLGGVAGDAFGARWGLRGRVRWLFIALFTEGIALMLFSQMSILLLAIPTLIVFSLFVQMSEGATFSVVPFVNKKALGAVAGIVGAGGNAGAVAAGFLFKGNLPWPTALLILGGLVTLCSFCAFAVSFSTEAEEEAKTDHAIAIGEYIRHEEPESEPELVPA